MRKQILVNMDGENFHVEGDEELLEIITDYAEVNGYTIRYSKECQLCRIHTLNDDQVCDDDDCQAEFHSIKFESDSQ